MGGLVIWRRRKPSTSWRDDPAFVAGLQAMEADGLIEVDWENETARLTEKGAAQRETE